MNYQRIRYVAKMPSLTVTLSSHVIYTGPGDVVTNASAWWGIRAYSQATVGSTAIKLRRDSDNTTQSFVTKANGLVDMVAINAFAGGANLFVDTLYDQVSGTHNVVQATLADQPAFIPSGHGTLPVIRTSSQFEWLQDAGIFSISQPYTVSTVSDRTGNFTTQSDLFACNFEAGRNDAADTAFMFLPGGVKQTAAATDSAFHAIQYVANQPSGSDLNVDGTPSVSAGSLSTNSISGNVIIGMAPGPFAAFVGDWMEVGIWATAFSSGNSNSMSVNQHSFWSF